MSSFKDQKKIPDAAVIMICTGCSGEEIWTHTYNEAGINAFSAHETSQHPKGAFYRIQDNPSVVSYGPFNNSWRK